MCTSNLEAIEAKFSNTNPAVVMVAGKKLRKISFKMKRLIGA